MIREDEQKVLCAGQCAVHQEVTSQLSRPLVVGMRSSFDFDDQQHLVIRRENNKIGFGCHLKNS